MMNIKGSIHTINAFLYNEFIFSSKYKVCRHVTYWAFHIIVWGIFWVIMGHQSSLWLSFFKMFLWVPVFIFFGYPLAYIAVPRLLLNGKLWQFCCLIIIWGMIGIYINIGFKNFIYAPIHQFLGIGYRPSQLVFAPHSYLCMTTSAASPTIIRFFKLWHKKQQEWLQVQQEKIAAELHLLKAQLHPHFLFNTLNNIYSFALENSSKTPYLILKLSSLLRYILYECRSEEVMLEKELEVMKNYIDLERERYGEKIDITICMEVEIADKKIAPLLLLPFLENAFKHGTSEQLDKPWLRVGILVEGSLMTCKIVNSKNETGFGRKNGVGIHNVQSRLRLLYPGKYTLHLYDEGNQYIVNFVLQLPSASAFRKPLYNHQSSQKFSHETSLPAYR